MPFQPLPPNYDADDDADQLAFVEIATAVEELVYRMISSAGLIDYDSLIGDLGIEDDLQSIISDMTAKYWVTDSDGGIPDPDEYDDYVQGRLRAILNCTVGEVYNEAAYWIEKERCEEHQRMPTRFEREPVI
jgi:hypothetical protein